MTTNSNGKLAALKIILSCIAGYEEAVTSWGLSDGGQKGRMGRSTAACCHGVGVVIPTAVLYGSLALFTSTLHNVFLLYYVDTFVSVYKIDKVSFWLGEVSKTLVGILCFCVLRKRVLFQTVFLLWNSFNDPLFGWLSDRSFLSSPQ